MSVSEKVNILFKQLRNGLISLGLDPDVHPIEDYLNYVQLLSQWNKAYNLTAIRDPNKMVAYHVLDSLALLPYMAEGHCLDVGSGAGLPGLILALAMPDSQWILLDSNGKKIRFINHAIRDLKVSNAQAVCCRIEDFNPDTLFSTITARAWGKLNELYKFSSRMLKPSGKILAMKGPDVEAELSALDSYTINSALHILDVPGVESQRTVVVISTSP